MTNHNIYTYIQATDIIRQSLTSQLQINFINQNFKNFKNVFKCLTIKKP